jgi:hypothetical protein
LSWRYAAITHAKLDGGPSPLDLRRVLEAHAADERIRQSQQGLGRPIIAGKVAVGRQPGIVGP